MKRYSVSKRFAWEGPISEKVGQVCRMFGVSVKQLSDKAAVHECSLEIGDGDVVYITGPSGSGKSVLLRELEKLVPAGEKVNLDEIELVKEKTVIDCIEGDFLGGLKFLSTAGLNDVYCVLGRPANLSEGEQWRFRLASALAMKKQFIFADEFCSNLDRVSAAVISYNIRKFAKREGVTFVLAGSQEDILLDLRPDVMVIKELAGEAEVVYKDTRRI
ncbi:MAG: ATP-binding cassette domain-containing protein [Planctomycetota bacterium]|jgi:ABC-type ATPase with predicted acetyltransferase domain